MKIDPPSTSECIQPGDRLTCTELEDDKALAALFYRNSLTLGVHNVLRFCVQKSPTSHPAARIDHSAARFRTENGSSRGRNLALAVLRLPSLLDSGAEEE